MTLFAFNEKSRPRREGSNFNPLVLIFINPRIYSVQAHFFQVYLVRSRVQYCSKPRHCIGAVQADWGPLSVVVWPIRFGQSGAFQIKVNHHWYLTDPSRLTLPWLAKELIVEWVGFPESRMNLRETGPFAWYAFIQPSPLHRRFSCSGDQWRLQMKQCAERIKERYPNAYTPWTVEELDFLEREFRAGLSLWQLSDRLGRQPGAVKKRLERLGLI